MRNQSNDSGASKRPIPITIQSLAALGYTDDHERVVGEIYMRSIDLDSPDAARRLFLMRYFCSLWGQALVERFPECDPTASVMDDVIARWESLHNYEQRYGPLSGCAALRLLGVDPADHSSLVDLLERDFAQLRTLDIGRG
jgi:hypothetical protein